MIYCHVILLFLFFGRCLWFKEFFSLFGPLFGLCSWEELCSVLYDWNIMISYSLKSMQEQDNFFIELCDNIWLFMTGLY